MQGFPEHQLCRAEEIENHKFYSSYSFTYGFVFILKHSSPLIRHLATFSLECCMQRGERKAQTVQLVPCDVESTWRGLITRVFPYNWPAGRKCWLHPKLYTQHKDFRAQRGQALAPHEWSSLLFNSHLGAAAICDLYGGWNRRFTKRGCCSRGSEAYTKQARASWSSKNDLSVSPVPPWITTTPTPKNGWEAGGRA